MQAKIIKPKVRQIKDQHGKVVNVISKGKEENITVIRGPIEFSLFDSHPIIKGDRLGPMLYELIEPGTKVEISIRRLK